MDDMPMKEKTRAGVQNADADQLMQVDDSEEEQEKKRTALYEKYHVPRAFSLTEIPVGYADNLWDPAMTSMFLEGGKPLCDLPLKDRTSHGGPAKMYVAIRKLIEKCATVEARNSWQQNISTGGEKVTDTDQKAAPNEVMGCILGMTMGTAIKPGKDAWMFRVAAVGYDPKKEWDRKHFKDIFRGAPKEATDAFENKKIYGIMHRDKLREKQLKNEYDRGLTVHDGVNIWHVVHGTEGGLEYKGDDGNWVDIEKKIKMKVLSAIAGYFTTDSFTIVGQADKADVLDRVLEQFKATGFTLSEGLLDNLAWLGTDMSHRAKDVRLRVTDRFPKSWRYGTYADDKGSEEWAQSRQELEPAHKAFDAALQEVRRITDYTHSAYTMAWHKGSDKWGGWKTGVLGEGNLWWKQAICDFTCREFMPLFRELAGNKPDFDPAHRTEYRRLVEDELHDRMGNVVRVDKDGKRNRSNDKRDVAAMDLTIPGIISLHDATEQYTLKRWGGVDEESQKFRIGGYDRMIRSVLEYDTIEDDDERGTLILQTVNVGRRENKLVRHIDEMSMKDLTQERDGVANIDKIVAEAHLEDDLRSKIQTSADAKTKKKQIDDADAVPVSFEEALNEYIKQRAEKRAMTEDKFIEKEGLADISTDAKVAKLAGLELIDGLAKSRFEREIKSSTLIFLESIYRNMGLIREVDTDLRWRTTLKDAPEDSTVMQHLQYTMTDLARKPDEEIMIDGEHVTGEEANDVRKYYHALKHVPGVVRDMFSDERWRDISSRDWEDPKMHGHRLKQFNEMLDDHKVLAALAPLVGEATVDPKLLLKTLLGAEKGFIEGDSKVIDAAIEQAHEKEEGIGYNKSVIAEVFKASAPRATMGGDEYGQEGYFAKLRTVRLLTKYGTQLRDIRKAGSSPYDPREADLFSEKNATERDALLTELATDLFESEDFKRIGAAFSSRRVKQAMQEEGVEAPDEETALREYASKQMYIYLMQVGARYDAFGEQLMETNTFGTKSTITGRTEVGNLVRDIGTLNEHLGDFNIRLDQLSEEDKNERVVSPRSRAPYAKTTVMRDFTVSSPTPEHVVLENRQEAVRILSDNGYTRYLMLSLARNQKAYREFSELQRTGGDVNVGAVEQILNDNEVDPSHKAFIELTNGESANFDVIEGELKNVHDNAMRATAAYLGVNDPNLDDFARWIDKFGTALIARAQGDNDKAMKHLEAAIGPTKAMRYNENARPDLRVITLNERSRLRVENIEKGNLTNEELKAEIGELLEESTAAWRYSRNDKLDLEMNESRGYWGDVRFWLEQRFSNANEDIEETEDPEAVSFMALGNALASRKLSWASKEGRRSLFLRTGGAAAAATPIVTATGGPLGLIPAGIAALAYVPVWLTERLRVAEKLAKRSNEVASEMDKGQDNEKGYTQHTRLRAASINNAKTAMMCGDGSWFKFLRNNHLTFDLNRRALGLYDWAAGALDPLTTKQLLHASEFKMSEKTAPILMERLQDDTVEARALKKEALFKGSRHCDASPTDLETSVISNDDQPKIIKLVDRTMRNVTMKPGIWGGLLNLAAPINPFSKYWGARLAARNLKRYREGTVGVDGTQERVAVNKTAAQTYEELAKAEWGTFPKLKKSYERESRTMWERAVARWRRTFKNDNSIAQSWTIGISALQAELKLRQAEMQESGDQRGLAEVEALLEKTETQLW